MEPYTMAFKLDPDRVQLTLRRRRAELLRASLPPPSRFWTAQPAKALMNSLANWLDAPLRVVLDAKDPGDGCSLALIAEIGTGLHTPSHDAASVGRRRRRAAYLRGVGDFREFDQLCALDRLSGGGR